MKSIGPAHEGECWEVPHRLSPKLDRSSYTCLGLPPISQAFGLVHGLITVHMFVPIHQSKLIVESDSSSAVSLLMGVL